MHKLDTLSARFSRCLANPNVLITLASQDLEDFPSIFESAITDFRTLLSNSAFGDALLLKMVVICIFSVTHVADAKSLGVPPITRPSGNSNDAGSGAGSEASREGAQSRDGGDTGTEGSGGDNSERKVRWSETEGAGSSPSDADATAAAARAEEVRRQARLTYPLALAFGVAAQIGRHVRTQEPTHPSQGSQHGHGRSHSHHRHGSHGSLGGHGGGEAGLHPSHHLGHHTSPPQPVVVYGIDSKSRPSSNQPQPRPLGSRLLGPVVLFCDWLTAQPHLLNADDEKPNSSSAGGSSAGARGNVASRAGGAGVASVAVQEVRVPKHAWRP